MLYSGTCDPNGTWTRSLYRDRV